MTPYLRSCIFNARLTPMTWAVAIFTRDKIAGNLVPRVIGGRLDTPFNCYHLSLSFVLLDDHNKRHPIPRDVEFSRDFVPILFRPPNLGDVLVEPPGVDLKGKRSEYWHYRLPTDPTFQHYEAPPEFLREELAAAGWMGATDPRVWGG